MLEKISLSLTRFLIRQNIVNQEDEEVYVYGWSITISTLGSFAVMLFLGAYLEQLLGTVLFITFFILLRMYAGGYHADSYGRCFLITMLIYGFAPILHFYLPASYIDWTLVILSFVSIIITWCFAPVDHPNKPLDDRSKVKNKEASRYIVLVQAIMIMLACTLQPQIKQYLLWAVSGMTMTSLTLLYVAICNPYRKEGS